MSAVRRGRGPWFDGAVPRVIAHRGLALAHPENSLGAFRAALDAGASHLETDAHATRDGVAVLAHDPDLSRMTGDPRRVGQLTHAELGGIPRGGDQICTLFDALQTFPSARFNLDVKDPKAVPGVIDAIRRSGAEERVLIASFRSSRRRRVARALGDVPTSASSEQIVPAVIGASAHLGLLTRAALRGVDAVQIPRSVLGLPTTSRSAIAAFHRAGVEVHVWTINDPQEIDELLELGVDGIVSDRCDLVVEALERRR